MSTRQRVKKPCKWTGCSELGGRRQGYCATHTLVAKQCVFDDCHARVASWNYYALCKEHRWLSHK